MKRAAAALFGILALAACAGRAPAVPAPSPVVPKERVAWPDAVLYFAIVDRWADGDAGNDAGVDRRATGTFHGGDLAGLTSHLDELSDLGITALWITPVVKNIPGFVTGAGFPDWAYHGYWPDDFTALDARFGTEAELKALVDAAHARGIRVLLDVVYNHAGYGSHYVSDPATRMWLRTEDKGTCGSDDLTTCVAGLPDWKTERPEVADFVMLPQLDLARRVGLDGFRLDTVKHVDHPFWDLHRKRTREIAPDFFLLGEVWGGDAKSLDPWFEPDELDAGFDFSFQGSTLAWVEGRGRTVAFDRYLASRQKVRAGHLLAHFLSSHDVPGALFQLGGDVGKFELAALLQMTTAGLPVVYYGEEVGRIGGDWPDNRSDMPWDGRDVLPGKGLPRNEELRAFYKKLIAVRAAHPALSRGSHESVASDGDLLVFARRDAERGETVVVAANRGASPATATFPLPPDWSGAPGVSDLLDGTGAALSEGRVTIVVPAGRGRVLGVASSSLSGSR